MTDLEPVGDWAILQQQAEVLARSQIVPQAFRNRPNDVIVAALMGRELGMGVTTALSHINVINGKGTLSAQGMVAVVRQAGHSITGESTPKGARVSGRRIDNGDEMAVEFTETDRLTAGLDSKPWKQYPKAMFWARAVSQLCRDLFPDVLAGLAYTSEELDGPVHPDDLAGEPFPVLEPTAADLLRGRLNDLDGEARKRVRSEMRESGIGDDLEVLDADELDQVNLIVDVVTGVVDGAELEGRLLKMPGEESPVPLVLTEYAEAVLETGGAPDDLAGLEVDE